MLIQACVYFDFVQQPVVKGSWSWYFKTSSSKYKSKWNKPNPAQTRARPMGHVACTDFLSNSRKQYIFGQIEYSKTAHVVFSFRTYTTCDININNFNIIRFISWLRIIRYHNHGWSCCRCKLTACWSFCTSRAEFEVSDSEVFMFWTQFRSRRCCCWGFWIQIWGIRADFYHSVHLTRHQVFIVGISQVTKSLPKVKIRQSQHAWSTTVETDFQAREWQHE